MTVFRFVQFLFIIFSINVVAKQELLPNTNSCGLSNSRKTHFLRNRIILAAMTVKVKQMIGHPVRCSTQTSRILLLQGGLGNGPEKLIESTSNRDVNEAFTME